MFKLLQAMHREDFGKTGVTQRKKAFTLEQESWRREAHLLMLLMAPRPLPPVGSYSWPLDVPPPICSSPSLCNHPSAKARMVMLLTWLKTMLIYFIPIELNSKFCFQTTSIAWPFCPGCPFSLFVCKFIVTLHGLDSLGGLCTFMSSYCFIYYKANHSAI